MNKSLSKILFILWGLIAPCLAQPYMVTDVSGTPRANDTVLKLLSEVYQGELLKLEAGDRLTITCRKDGSRAVLTGPKQGRLQEHFLLVEGQEKSRVFHGGRGLSKRMVKDISRTLGAVHHRDLSQKPSVLLSQGVLLKPELVWAVGDGVVAHSVTISTPDGVVKGWRDLTEPVLDLSSLGLRKGKEYQVEFTSIYTPGTSSNLNSTTKTSFVLAPKSLRRKVEKRESASFRAYQDSRELTPLSIYLAYLIDQRMYAEAYRLLESTPFAEEKFDSTRENLLTLVHSESEPGQ